MWVIGVMVFSSVAVLGDDLISAILAIAFAVVSLTFALWAIKGGEAGDGG